MAAFVLGGFWYSPLLFLKPWAKGAASAEPKEEKHRSHVMIASFVLSLIAAAAFAWHLGPNPELANALKQGALIGGAWVGSSFGINYLFAGRSLVMLLIDAGYHFSQFLIYALVLAT